jgi:hypothetical protein
VVEDVVLLPATVVDVVEDVDVVAIVLGRVVVAKPVGSSIRKVLTAFRAAAGGCGIVVPVGTNAIVMSWPSSRRIPPAFEAGTSWPLVEVGDGHVSTEIEAGLPAQSWPFL